jgi:hypothetical protein
MGSGYSATLTAIILVVNNLGFIDVSSSLNVTNKLEATAKQNKEQLKEQSQNARVMLSQIDKLRQIKVLQNV